MQSRVFSHFGKYVPTTIFWNEVRIFSKSAVADNPCTSVKLYQRTGCDRVCLGHCRCPVLLVTGQLSIFNGTTRGLHQAILKTCEDKAKVEFIEVANVGNVLEEQVS